MGGGGEEEEDDEVEVAGVLKWPGSTAEEDERKT